MTSTACVCCGVTVAWVGVVVYGWEELEFHPSSVQPTYQSILGQDTEAQIATDVVSSGGNM